MAPIRVVVPLDGSELAEEALSHLPVLASLGPIYLRLVAVTENAERLGVADPKEWQARQTRLLRQYLQGQQRRLESPDMEVEISVRRGNPAEAIVIDARRFNADFILITTHGRSGLKRWRVGSVADKVIRSSPCNTLVVGAKAREAAGKLVSSIMTPLDGSELAETALPMATRLAGELGADLHMVRVVTYMPAEEVMSVALDRMTALADDYLRERAAERWQIDPKTAVIIGSPADELLDYAEKHSIDLIVITSHGQGGLLRAALGSVADRLIGGASPVLIVRRPVAEE